MSDPLGGIFFDSHCIGCYSAREVYTTVSTVTIQLVKIAIVKLYM